MGALPLPYWARDWILDVEGGLVDDASDPGGVTKYGISQRAYPGLDIPNLTQDDAARIYERDYYQAVHAREMPPQIALAVFDSAVNQGPGQAVKFLQFSLDVHVDGEVGPETIQALHGRIALDGVPGLLADYLSRRADHYSDLAHNLPRLRRFTRGWFRRLFRLEAQCLGLTQEF